VHSVGFMIRILTQCNFSKPDNAVPEDGVTAPKHVGAILM